MRSVVPTALPRTSSSRSPTMVTSAISGAPREMRRTGSGNVSRRCPPTSNQVVIASASLAHSRSARATPTLNRNLIPSLPPRFLSLDHDPIDVAAPDHGHHARRGGTFPNDPVRRCGRGGPGALRVAPRHVADPDLRGLHDPIIAGLAEIRRAHV